MSASPQKALEREPSSLPLEPQATGEPSPRAMEIIRSLDRYVVLCVLYMLVCVFARDRRTLLIVKGTAH